MEKNIELQEGEVTIKITNLKLSKERRPNFVPRHKFLLSIENYEEETLFSEKIVVRGYSTDFEFRKSALACIKKVLKGMDKDLIPQSPTEKDKFPKFLEVFNDEMNQMVKCGDACADYYDLFK